MTSLLILKSMLFANAIKTRVTKMKEKSKMKTKLIKCKRRNMCRTCDAEKGVIPIIGNIVHPNLSRDIHHFSGVMVEKTDGLPQHMCQNCLDLLNGCIMFREMCQKTNKKIVKFAIKKETNVEANDFSSDDVNTLNSNNVMNTLNSSKETNTVKSSNDICIVNSTHAEYLGVVQPAESDSSYNIPSPTCSEDLPALCCVFCDEYFINMRAYKMHILNCHCQEEPGGPKQPKQKFLCDVCGKTTNSGPSLRAHKTTHENVFPFKCEVCPYRGRTMDLLKVHKRSHLAEAEKPYRCTQCPKSTTSASNLSKHMRHMHSSYKPHKCNYCEKTFLYQHDMKRHIKDIHLRLGTVECNLCFKKFSTKKILRSHQYKVHKLKAERHGRIPAYLQCRVNEPCHTGTENDAYDKIVKLT